MITRTLIHYGMNTLLLLKRHVRAHSEVLRAMPSVQISLANVRRVDCKRYSPVVALVVQPIKVAHLVEAVQLALDGVRRALGIFVSLPVPVVVQLCLVRELDWCVYLRVVSAHTPYVSGFGHLLGEGHVAALGKVTFQGHVASVGFALEVLVGGRLVREEIATTHAFDLLGAARTRSLDVVRVELDVARQLLARHVAARTL